MHDIEHQLINKDSDEIINALRHLDNIRITNIVHKKWVVTIDFTVLPIKDLLQVQDPEISNDTATYFSTGSIHIGSIELDTGKMSVQVNITLPTTTLTLVDVRQLPSEHVFTYQHTMKAPPTISFIHVTYINPDIDSVIDLIGKNK